MDFTEKFNTYSNAQLLNIIDYPNSYQTLAVETAKAIFSTRQLSEDEIDIARQELATLLQTKEEKALQKKEENDKWKNDLIAFYNKYSPFYKGRLTYERLINIVSFGF